MRSAVLTVVTVESPRSPLVRQHGTVIPSDHVVDHHLGALAYRSAGSGRPILFLHGLGGCRHAWEPQLEELGDAFRCVAWDLPGYGDSEPHVPLTFASIADAAVGLLDALDVDRTDVVGLSFGGQQALHLALRHPERVDRLVLADTSARFGADGTDVEEWKRLRLDPLDAGLTPAEIAEAVVDTITAAGFAGRERERMIAAFGHIPPDGLRAAVECLPTHDVVARLAEIDAMTLVVVGELDEETPPSYAEVLATGIPNAELHVIRDAGHLTPAEAPAEFNRLVHAFLTR